MSADQSTPGSVFDLSIIIPAFNEERLLGEQLTALAGQSWSSGSWEVIVVDNKSTDRTTEVAEAFRDRIEHLRVVKADARAGLSYARNTGIGEAWSPHIAICDADDVVAPGWIAAMGEALRHHRLVTGQLEVDRLNPLWLAETRGRRFEAGPMTFAGLFPVVSGGNLGLWRSVWAELGGFDEHVVGAEDTHFSMKAWHCDIPIHFEPNAVLHYRYRDDPRSLWRQGRTYGRARVIVCKELRAHGQRPRRLAGWRSWMWLLTHLPTLVSRHGRVAWAWVAGNRFGQLEGSLRFRTLYI